ncbi:MAG TPA: porphobilinogen synthase, partial [Dokdonella sp.]
LAQFEKDMAAGVRQFLLFPVPAHKSNRNFAADFVGTALQQMRQRAGSNATIWVDTCLCSFTESGHCCVHDSRGKQDLAATHAALGALGLTYVRAGADGISPSDMNDGRVAFLRGKLDEAGFDIAPIMSYSTKFASNFYGPFRDAADSAPQYGDRKSYQLDVRNRTDALASSRRCAEEGADLLMVKPGQPSADLIRPIHEQTGLPVGAYQVSGEYTSLVLLAKEKFVDFDAALTESWYNLRRAGASYIITYGARLARGLGF